VRISFERYVDDVVAHCVSARQAREVLAVIGARTEQVCQDGRRRDSHENTSFTFPGNEFRQRAARNKRGRRFSAFKVRSVHAIEDIVPVTGGYNG
jgi:RNA-directed DNA polymerase